MDTISDENTLKIGSMLLEFEIISILGVGGFGITYKTRDTNLDKFMVIKEYMPSQFASRSQTTVTHTLGNEVNFEWGLKRFLEEAKVLSKFDHINIVKARRFFEANNTAYFVMDFYDGQTLKDYLDDNQNHKFTQNEIVSVMMPILEGLKAVHKAGFLHRDIAPDNIFLRKTKAPILIDFGASRNALGTASQNISAIIKQGYSPPEQYTSSSKQDETTDLYALSAVIFHLITGSKPIEATSRQNEVLNDNKDPIENIEELYKSDFNNSFLKTVTKGLSIKQKDRLKSISEYQKGLIENENNSKIKIKVIILLVSSIVILAIGYFILTKDKINTTFDINKIEVRKKVTEPKIKSIVFEDNQTITKTITINTPICTKDDILLGLCKTIKIKERK